MRDFLDRLNAYIHWVVFFLLEALSGFLLFQFNHYQGSVWFTQANTLAALVEEWEADGLAYLHLNEENAALTRRNVVLQYNLDVMRHELAELKQDTSITRQAQLRLLKDIDLIPAKVIANSVDRKDNYLTINRGSMDGVQPEMGVVSGTGVVGIVSQVTPHYALVMSVLNSHSSISCRLRDSEYFGYMKWTGGNPLQTHMDDVPRHARVMEGNIVETSGYSSVFPAGIFLGKVAKVHNSEDGLAFELEIQMSTDLAHIRDVFVVKQQNQAEIDTLRIHEQ